MIVLSLKPRHAEAILAGSKTVEFRRTRPRVRTATPALLYATTPVRALVGTCIVTAVESGHPAALWHAHGARSGLDHGEFLSYFDGVHTGSALSLTSPRRLGRPIPLPELRSTPNGFHAPQSFAYVETETATDSSRRPSPQTSPTVPDPVPQPPPRESMSPSPGTLSP